MHVCLDREVGISGMFGVKSGFVCRTGICLEILRNSEGRTFDPNRQKSLVAAPFGVLVYTLRVFCHECVRAPAFDHACRWIGSPGAVTLSWTTLKKSSSRWELNTVYLLFIWVIMGLNWRRELSDAAEFPRRGGGLFALMPLFSPLPLL